MLQFRSAQEQEFMEEDKDMSQNYNDPLAKEKFWGQVRSLLGKLSTMEREVFFSRLFLLSVDRLRRNC